MDGYTKLLKKLLLDAGCYIVRYGKGDHETWFSPIVNKPFTVDGRIMSRHMANVILKQAGLPKRF